MEEHVNASEALTENSEGLVRGPDGLMRPVWANRNELLTEYYDSEWGMPVADERGIFERLSLEAFQAGLSWLTILRKREAFRVTFAEFVPDVVASFSDADVARLLSDSGIVRNRRKIAATITNAGATVALRERGGLAALVWSFMPECTPHPRTPSEVPSQSPESVALAKALRAEGFTMVGPTTMYALMGAIGIVDVHLLGSHRRASSGIWEE